MTDQISVVIPAHERVDLVRAAMDSVISQEGVETEIIVTDDSRGHAVADLVSHAAERHGGLRWMCGPRTGVAAENWNHGLDEARFPLKVVLHQDERYVDRRFLWRAAQALARPGVAAAVGGVKVTGVTRASRFGLVAPLRHAPFAPALLPLINWLGPTGALVFRGEHRFDPAFVQLVDVEFYGRVLRHGRLACLKGVSVASLGHHPDSITARIDTQALALAEIDRLAGLAPPAISPAQHAIFRAALELRARLRRAKSGPGR